jgi:hypothetical protein
MKPTQKQLNQLCRMYLFLKQHPKQLPAGYDGLLEFNIEMLLQDYNLSRLTLIHEASIYEHRLILKAKSEILMVINSELVNQMY